MGRVWGLIFMVAAIYVGMEIYTVGTQNAFGGTLAWLGEPLPEGKDINVDDRRITQRVGDKVTSDIELGFQRKADAIDGAGWDQEEDDF